MADRPNILFIMTDDHASHAMSCYGSRINETPHMDRIANEGMRFDNCFCTNSICTPSRAVILAGTYNHINGVTTLATHMDNRLLTYPKVLQQAGYQTAIFGKWHLGQGPEHCPTGFDDWAVLPGQGLYHDPLFVLKGPDGGARETLNGYATDLITDMCIDWIGERDPDQPFCLMCHHKAPHRPWDPDDKHATMYDDVEIPEPETFDDDYSNRSRAAAEATLRIERDLHRRDLKVTPPPDLSGPELREWERIVEMEMEIDGEKLSGPELKKWKYQRYIKDYLRCIASVDDNIGRLLDVLDDEGLAQDTIVVYTSDQGFFLGDHGWFDKRFMYEESLRMPFIIRYPKAIESGSVNKDMILNLDFAPTFLDYADAAKPDGFQGTSFRPLLEGETPEGWRTSMYYRYWMHKGGHNVYAHYGVRTLRYKLIYYYGQALGQQGATDEPTPPEWELFDMEKDPFEINSVYHDPAYAHVVSELKDEMHRLMAEVGDEPHVEEVG